MKEDVKTLWQRHLLVREDIVLSQWLKRLYGSHGVGDTLRMLEMRYGPQKASNEDIAKHFNMTRQAVEQRLNKAAKQVTDLML